MPQDLIEGHMIITQAHLDALEVAITTSTKSVEVDGKRIEYRTIDEMVTAANYIRARLNESKSTSASGPSVGVLGRC